MTRKPLYQQIASVVNARLNCEKADNTEWYEKHTKTLNDLKDMLPRGSGIDGENEIDLVQSTGEKLVIHTSFHHMNDVGMYDGWTDHTIRVYPSLIHGIRLTISGRNRRDIKDYLYYVFDYALRREEETQ